MFEVSLTQDFVPLKTNNLNSMKYNVSAQIKNLTAKINLPASKSISNRALIINALSYSPYPIRNLSESDDTKVLEAAEFEDAETQPPEEETAE